MTITPKTHRIDVVLTGCSVTTATLVIRGGTRSHAKKLATIHYGNNLVLILKKDLQEKPCKRN